MGANNSHLPDTFLEILSEEPVNTLLSQEVRKLTYEEFVNLIGELNLL